jgi:hypothetical protein
MRKSILQIILVLVIGFHWAALIPAYSEPPPDCCHCQSEPILSRTGPVHDRELLFELQEYLKGLSLYKTTPNGRFDRTMETAVIAFQKSRRLKPTGIIDRETWQALGSVETGPTTEKLPSGRLEVLVELNSLTLTILVDRKPFRSFPVAIGKLETPSPIGSWKVVSKGYWAKGETKWLGLSVPFGIYGIHGTNKPWSIGRRASNGCIRMFNHHLEFVYQWVNPGTTVYIDGDPFRDRRGLKRGMIGSDVYYLQIRLKQLGYYTQKPNGVFDYWTEKALRQCQTDLGLPVTGEISAKEYYRLRLYPTD